MTAVDRMDGEFRDASGSRWWLAELVLDGDLVMSVSGPSEAAAERKMRERIAKVREITIESIKVENKPRRT